jgi:hypothetical protein
MAILIAERRLGQGIFTCTTYIDTTFQFRRQRLQNTNLTTDLDYTDILVNFTNIHLPLTVNNIQSTDYYFQQTIFSFNPYDY